MRSSACLWVDKVWSRRSALLSMVVPCRFFHLSFISGQSTLLLIFINGDVNVVFGVFGLYALCYRQH